MTKHIFLIRHGETDHNLKKKFQGHLDTPLNDNGIFQAAELFERFAGNDSYFNLLKTNMEKESVYFYTSDLQRAANTAKSFIEKLKSHKPLLASSLNPVLSTIDLKFSDLIREYQMGKFQDSSFKEMEQKEPEITQKFLDDYDKDPINTAYPEGESKQMVWTRLEHFFDNFLKDSGLTFIFSHGGTLRVAYELLTSHPYEGKFTNCHIVALKKLDPDQSLFEQF